MTTASIAINVCFDEAICGCARWQKQLGRFISRDSPTHPACLGLLGVAATMQQRSDAANAMTEVEDPVISAVNCICHYP